MTPAYQQYSRFKKQHPDCVLFFQLGDFYETFDDDAKTIAAVCDVVLTSRDFGKSGKRPLAGVPVRSADAHIAKLVAAGYKVAVVDQVEQTGGPAATLKNSTALVNREVGGAVSGGTKGLFDRRLARIVTPGTVLDPAMLDARTNNYLVAVVQAGDIVGVAAADVSTGEFTTCQTLRSTLPELFERLQPAEVIAPRGLTVPTPTGRATAPLTEREPWQFDLAAAREAILRHFAVGALEAFGCADQPLAIRAAGALLIYLQETQRDTLGRFSKLVTTTAERTMVLDAPTRRNLELTQQSRTGASAGSLLAVLDVTKTPMGGRLLRRWLFAPLIDLDGLQARQAMVTAFHEDTARRADAIALLGRLGDLERLVQRVASSHAGPRDVVALARSLAIVPNLQAVVADHPNLAPLAARLDPCAEVVDLIRQALRDDPPSTLADGGVIRPGYSPELDDLNTASKDGRAFIATLERRERERTGISSLKVGFNKVFGYYLEISHANRARVPDDYIRKQTLVGAERYITPEMKEIEAQVLNAQEKIIDLETTIFQTVCRDVASAADRIRATAAAVAELDVTAALAEVAVRRGYCKPELHRETTLRIRGGRHPVVEAMLDEDRFVPNDVTLSNDDQQILVITGPNMAGKSVFIRQVALIVLLAQIGSYVPATEASIGLVDRIFTRVGANDDPAAGQSTFMVEMAETANILHHATSRSLVILDEVGRGTSTYDGLAIARAIVEYLHDAPRLGAKTLFATHYHELAALEETLPRVRNARMEVLEEGDRVVFLHRVVPGGADKSYGLYVARLAGVPRGVLRRAEEILRELEAKALPEQPLRRAKEKSQLSMLPATHGVLEELAMLDVDSLTPRDALLKLYEFHTRAKMTFKLVQ